MGYHPWWYNYKVEYRPGAPHPNADVLSRLPLPKAISEVPEAGETILLMANLHLSPVTAKQIRQWTDRDSVLSNVRRLVQFGWELLLMSVSSHFNNGRKN